MNPNSSSSFAALALRDLFLALLAAAEGTERTLSHDRQRSFFPACLSSSLYFFPQVQVMAMGMSDDPIVNRCHM